MPRRAHIIEQFADGIDLLIAPRQAKFGAGQGWAAFDDGELETAVFVGVFDAQESGVAPRRVVGAGGFEAEGADDLRDTTLGDKVPEWRIARGEILGDLDHGWSFRNGWFGQLGESIAEYRQRANGLARSRSSDCEPLSAVVQQVRYFV